MKWWLLLGGIPLFSFTAFAGTIPIVDIDPVTRIGTGSSGTQQYSGFHEPHTDGMVGWNFNVKIATTVTQVGWFDDFKDGLSWGYRVGLWKWPFDPNNPTQLLGLPQEGLIIPSGGGASLNGTWRVIDLPQALLLSPGTYQLTGLDSRAATDTTEYVREGPSNLRIEIGSYIWTPPLEGYEGFRPIDFVSVPGLDLGPMLFMDVPEPGTTASGLLLVFGSLSSQYRRRSPVL